MIERTWEGDGMSGLASFSDCETFRYTLQRRWNQHSFSLPIIMLNPSTATEQELDPTIRRCIAFAKREGFGGVHVNNLFAFRSPSPAAMKSATDPVGPGNREALDETLDWATKNGLPILCGWGAHGSFLNQALYLRMRATAVRANLVCLGKTGSGEPKHPLYIRADQPFEAL